MAKIMIVNDAAFMRMTLRDLITKIGHQVLEEAENGAVTMDITMPEKEGVLHRGT